jgi:hypothetical protein
MTAALLLCSKTRMPRVQAAAGAKAVCGREDAGKRESFTELLQT